ncbi:MAG TPA: hypothetical protein VGE31_01295 [Candidatus Paceibacterota bacterium]
MDTFFSILKKSLVATIALVFAFVVIYVPQQYGEKHHTVPQAEAIFGGGIVLDPVNLVQNTISAVRTLALHLKEFVLDGIAWAIAKAIVSSMLSSLINWINSGFQGRPAFLTDLGDFLLEAADRGIGEYINSLGGIGSMICSPFQLDIQIALSLQYATAREGRPTGECTLSGIVNNIEDFYAGTFTETSWDDWFTITSRPEKYTELGQLFEAEAGLQRRIISDQYKAETEVKLGSGFLSGKICRAIEGSSGPTEKCTITKPGKYVQEALSFQTDSGRQSLIQADEFNELIAALLGQLANRALTGAAGLLGLSGGTGYTYSGYAGGSYVGSMVQQSNQQAIDSGNTSQNGNTSNATMFSDAVAVQQEYRTLAQSYQSRLAAVAADSDNENQAAAGMAYSDAVNIISKTQQDETRITELQSEYQTLGLELQAANLDAQRQAEIQTRQAEIMAQFSQLGVYTRPEMEASRTTWEALVSS